MEEIWKDVEGWEGFYQVSNLGRVKRLPKQILRSNNIKQTFKERQLSLSHDKDGYVQISLSHEGITIKKKAHRLVMESFIMEIPINMEVNHINGIKDDNRLVNLEIVTKSENMIHAYRNGLKKYVGGNEVPVAAYTIERESQKQTIKVIGKFKEFESIASASRSIGCATSGIKACLKGLQKTAGGYKWEYAK